MTVRISGDGGHLPDQPEHLELAQLCVFDVPGFRVEGGERGDCADQHPHRVGVIVKTVHELLDVFMDDGVEGDIVQPLIQLGPGRQFPVENQVGGLQIAALLRQLFDRIAPITQDPLIPIYESYPAGA